MRTSPWLVHYPRVFNADPLDELLYSLVARIEGKRGWNDACLFSALVAQHFLCPIKLIVLFVHHDATTPYCSAHPPISMPVTSFIFHDVGRGHTDIEKS